MPEEDTWTGCRDERGKRRVRQRSRQVPEGLAGEGSSALPRLAAEEPLRVQCEKHYMQTHQPEKQLAGSEKRRSWGIWGSKVGGVMGQAPGAWVTLQLCSRKPRRRSGEGSPSKHWPFVGCEWKHGRRGPDSGN